MPKEFGQLGNSGGGDPNILKLEASTQVRPLDTMVAEYRQHAIQDPNDDEKVSMLVCPGPRTCPLCRKPADPEFKQYFPMSRRFAVNVWDFGSNSVKVLVGGPQIFDELRAAAQAGINPTTCDWTITKTGARINTKYQVIRHDVSDGPQVDPSDLHDISKYENPESVERIFEILEKFGIDYDALPIPSFSADEADAFVFPYTSHKGETVEYVLANDQSYAEWMHTTKLEQGQLGDPLFLALQAAMETRGMVPPLEESLSSFPEPSEATPEPQNQTGGAPPAMEPANGASGVPELPAPNEGETRLIAPNKLPVNVPDSSVDSLLAAGFSKPVEEKSDEKDLDPATPVEVLVGGQAVTLPYEQAASLVASGSGAWPETKQEPESVPLPALPGPDDIVQLKIGDAEVPMAMAQAEPLVKAGSASFIEEGVASAYQAHKDALVQEDAADAESVREQAEAEHAGATPAADPDKPFVCPVCNKGYKTQGGLTQHTNKEHAGAPPTASAAGAPTASAPPASGGEADGSRLERVKDMIARAPFAQDYTKIIEIFTQETNKNSIAEMDDAELQKVEIRVKAETEKA